VPHFFLVIFSIFFSILRHAPVPLSFALLSMLFSFPFSFCSFGSLSSF
jgi:hypothetical protein